MYKLTGNGVIEIETGKSIPADELNEDWQAYQMWLSGGNTPLPQFTDEEIAQKQIDIQNSKTITRRQLLFWLFLNKGIKEEAIFTAINSIPDESNRYLAEKSYTGTSNFEYGNPFVKVIGTALGLTEQELQQCFDEAKEM